MERPIRKTSSSAVELHIAADPRDYWPKGKQAAWNEKVRTKLWYSYIPVDDKYRKSIRWYYVGSILIAIVYIMMPDYYRDGDYYIVQTTWLRGNGGKWFTSEKALHDFLAGELERLPSS